MEHGAGHKVIVVSTVKVGELYSRPSSEIACPFRSVRPDI